MTIMRANMAKQIANPGAVKGDPIKRTKKIFLAEMKRLTKKKK